MITLTLSEQLKEIRTRAALSQGDVAEKYPLPGFKPGNLSKFETGVEPGIKVLRRLAEAFQELGVGVELEIYFTLDGKRVG